MSQRTLSGCVSVSHWAPSSPPVSSSATNTSFSVAARGPPAAAGQRRGGDGLGGHLGLHVERAAAPQEAVGDVARPRVVRPLGGVGEHRVDVAEVGTASGRRRVAAQLGDEVRPLGVGAEQLDLEAGVARGSAARYSIAGALVARRVDGVEADQRCRTSSVVSPLELMRVASSACGSGGRVASRPCAAPATTSRSPSSWPTLADAITLAASAPRTWWSRPSPI